MATFDEHSPIIRHHQLHQENKNYEAKLNIKFYGPTDIDSRTGLFKCLSEKCTLETYHAHCLDCENIVYNTTKNLKQLPTFPAPHANPSQVHSKFCKHKELHDELPKYDYKIEKFTSYGHEVASCNKCGKGKITHNEILAKRNGYEFVHNAFTTNIGRTIRIAKSHVKDCGVDFDPITNDFRLSETKDALTGKDVFVCMTCEKLACSKMRSDVLSPDDFRFIKKQNALLHSNKHKREKDLQKQAKAREFKNQFNCSFRAPSTPIDLSHSEPQSKIDQEILECYCLRCGEVVFEADAPKHRAKHAELSKKQAKTWWDLHYYKLDQSVEKDGKKQVVMKYKCRTCHIMVKVVDLIAHADAHKDIVGKTAFVEKLKQKMEPLNFLVLKSRTDEKGREIEQMCCLKCGHLISGKIETSKNDAKMHHGKHQFLAALDNFLVKIKKNPDYVRHVPVVPVQDDDDEENSKKRGSYYGDPKLPETGPEPLEVYECSDKNCLKLIKFENVQEHVFGHIGAQACFDKKCLQTYNTEFHIHCTRCLDTVDVLANDSHQNKHDRDEQVNKINDAGDEVTQQENQLIPKGYDCKIIGCIEKGLAHLHCKRPNCDSPLEIGKGFEHCFNHNNSNNPNSAKNKTLAKYKVTYFGKRDDCTSRRCRLMNTEHLHCMQCNDVFEIKNPNWSTDVSFALHNHGHENLLNDKIRGYEIVKSVDGVAVSEADFEESQLKTHSVDFLFSYRCLEDGCGFVSAIKQSADLIENENASILSKTSERVDLTLSESKTEPITRPRLPKSLHNHTLYHKNMTDAEKFNSTFWPKTDDCGERLECEYKSKDHFHCNYQYGTGSEIVGCDKGRFTSKKELEEHHRLHIDSDELELRHIKTFNKYLNGSRCDQFFEVAESAICKASKCRTHYHCVYKEGSKYCHKSFTKKPSAMTHFGTHHRNDQIVEKKSNPITEMYKKNEANKIGAIEATTINPKNETKQVSSHQEI